MMVWLAGGKCPKGAFKAKQETTTQTDTTSSQQVVGLSRTVLGTILMEMEIQ